MWVNPKFATALPPPPPAPPEPSGKHVVTFDRSHGGRREELRVTLDEYEGHLYVSLRVWQQVDGAWWPSKKGCSVRPRELLALADALRAVAGALDRDHDRPRQVRATTTQARPPRQEPRRLMPLLEGPPRDDRDFDEFGGDDR